MSDKKWESNFAIKHNLKTRYNTNFGCGIGWRDIISEAFTKLEELGWKGQILQIKEKFGGLRIYVSHLENTEMLNVISHAESQSYLTCEACGQEGRKCNPDSSWTKTLCKECEKLSREKRWEKSRRTSLS